MQNLKHGQVISQFIKENDPSEHSFIKDVIAGENQLK